MKRPTNERQIARFHPQLRAIFRLWLGLAQMAGATLAIVLLWRTGLSSETVVAFLFTTLLTIVSRLRFRR